MRLVYRRLPVGALTSGTYSYKSRPWEIDYPAQFCARCSDGYNHAERAQRRSNSRRRSRSLRHQRRVSLREGPLWFRLMHSEERLQAPLLRKDGKLEPVSWSEALAAVAAKFGEVKARGGEFRTPSAPPARRMNYFLQKFARQGLGAGQYQ